MPSAEQNRDAGSQQLTSGSLTLDVSGSQPSYKIDYQGSRFAEKASALPNLRRVSNRLSPEDKIQPGDVIVVKYQGAHAGRGYAEIVSTVEYDAAGKLKALSASGARSQQIQEKQREALFRGAAYNTETGSYTRANWDSKYPGPVEFFVLRSKDGAPAASQPQNSRAQADAHSAERQAAEASRRQTEAAQARARLQADQGRRQQVPTQHGRDRTPDAPAQATPPRHQPQTRSVEIPRVAAPAPIEAPRPNAARVEPPRQPEARAEQQQREEQQRAQRAQGEQRNQSNEQQQQTRRVAPQPAPDSARKENGPPATAASEGAGRSQGAHSPQAREGEQARYVQQKTEQVERGREIPRTTDARQMRPPVPSTAAAAAPAPAAPPKVTETPPNNEERVRTEYTRLVADWEKLGNGLAAWSQQLEEKRNAPRWMSNPWLSGEADLVRQTRAFEDAKSKYDKAAEEIGRAIAAVRRAPQQLDLVAQTSEKLKATVSAIKPLVRTLE